jgi:arylsulfatase A-like enzyme
MPKGQPNVIFILTDQQRYDSTGLGGNPLGLTPNFDRLAGNGTYLQNCITPQPVCGPARSCLQSGRYATATGCWHNGIALPAPEARLAPAFNEAGYTTAYIGKWHLAPEFDGPVKEEQRGGYRYWLAANTLEFVSDAYDARLYDNQGNEVRLPGYRADAQTDAAIRYIDSHQNNPFFLFLSFIEPHFQNQYDNYPAPRGYAEKYIDAWTPPDLAELGGTSARHLPGYWGMIKRLDECLGRLQDALISLELEENTIVVFTSDHSCHFRTRNDEYKRSCHEASVHVPAALWGGPFNEGGSLKPVVSLLDLPPTLIDACGIKVPEAMQGHSLLPLVQRRSSQRPGEVLVQISEAEVGRAIRTTRWKYGVVAPGVAGNAVPASDTYQEKYLYDLQADPYELDNLAGFTSHRAVSDDLKARLIARMVAAGEEAPHIEDAPARQGGQRRVDATDSR